MPTSEKELKENPNLDYYIIPLGTQKNREGA